MNKTQTKIIERIYNLHVDGQCLTKLNEIEQALKLAEKYPNHFHTQRIGYRAEIFTIKDINAMPDFLRAKGSY